MGEVREEKGVGQAERRGRRERCVWAEGDRTRARLGLRCRISRMLRVFVCVCGRCM